jgi:preprotein translocase subunit SecB
MSDQDVTEPTNAVPQANGGIDPNDVPQIATIAQYIKDMSVENPSAPAVFQWQAQPQIDVQFNILVNRVNEEVHEVVLKINLKATSEQGAHFVVVLAYAGLFGLRNIPDEALPPFLLIEAPRMLFPFARQIVAEQVQNLGFPPVLLDPIDFAQAYMAQADALQEDGAAASDTGFPEQA